MRLIPSNYTFSLSKLNTMFISKTDRRLYTSTIFKTAFSKTLEKAVFYFIFLIIEYLGAFTGRGIVNSIIG